MKKLLLFTSILLLFSCRDKPRENVFLPKINFKRTQTPHYSKYFPNKKDSSQNYNRYLAPKINNSEPVPSFQSEVISNSNNKKKNKFNFFSYLFNTSKPKQKSTKENICSELLDINKTVINEQNSKLIDLKNDKLELLDELNKKERKFQQQKSQDAKENQRLSSEVNRLKRLIKILSTELK